MSQSRTGSGRSRSGHGFRRWSGREWAVRGVLALSALVLGYVSITNALANVIVKADARSAHALAPNDGRITAAFAQQSFSAAPDPSPASQQARLAMEALRHDPTAVEALNVLGLQAQLRSDDSLADSLFGYSVDLSRRELQPQIWAIEKSVARGDIAGALNDYDAALRTSAAAQRTLFPILASAISEPRIRAPLIEILASKPVWAKAFINYAAGRGTDPLAVAQFFRAGTARNLPIEDAERARVVTSLAAHGMMDEAWKYYGTFRPRLDRSRSRDPGFDLNAAVRTPFDWNVGNSTGLSAAILQGDDGGLLDFALPPGTGATVVTQTQLLPPGTYSLKGRSTGIDQPDRSRPYWLLSCRAGGELGRVDVPNSNEKNGTFSGQFTVPPDCPVQQLSLVARSSDRMSGLSGQIRNVQIAPAD